MENALVLKTKLDTKNFDKEIKYLEDEAEDLGLILKDAGKLSSDDVIKYERQLEKVNNRLKDLYKKQNDINSQGFKRVQDTLQNVNKSASNVGKSIVRWGLTLLGVRSAMTLIRSSLSTLSEYDDQLAKNVEYIRYVIAVALKPLIEYIVNLVFTLLQYINYIASAWFGVNLFANASAESMEKANKSSKGIAKNLKEANKELLGFDKINKLSSQKSSSGGADSGTVSPSMDLSKMLPQGDVPDWLKWIVEYKDEILALMAGIGAGLIAMKLGFSGIQSLGFGLTVFGIVEALQKLDEWYNKVIQQNGVLTGTFDILGIAIQAIAVAISGLALVIGSIPVALIGLFTAIIGYIVYFTDSVINSQREIQKSWDEIGKWLRKNLPIVGQFIDGWVKDIINIFNALIFGVWQGFSTLVSGILLLFKGDLSNGLKQIFRGIVNMIIGMLNTAISSVNTMLIPARALILAYGAVTGKKWNLGDISIPHIPYIATGAIINYPGKGVPISAMGGERGAEGVIPLTDTQAMERLGESIGKHVKINLDLTTEIEGRVLARVLKQINNEDIFARNGG